MSEITYIGERTPWGEPQLFGVERVDRRQHLYTVGKTGLGKLHFFGASLSRTSTGEKDRLRRGKTTC